MQDLMPSFFDELTKIAKKEPKPNPVRPYAKGIAGMTLGSGIGYLAMEAADRMARAGGGSGISKGMAKAIPIVGAISGFVGGLLQEKMLREARRAARHGG
jgi:hypothetical protein